MTCQVFTNPKKIYNTLSNLIPVDKISSAVDFNLVDIFSSIENKQKVAILPSYYSTISIANIANSNHSYIKYLNEAVCSEIDTVSIPDPAYFIIGTDGETSNTASIALTVAQQANLKNQSTIVGKFNNEHNSNQTIYWLTDYKESSKTVVNNEIYSHKCLSFGSNWILNLEQLQKPSNNMHITWLTKDFIFDPIDFITEAIDIVKHITLFSSNISTIYKINSIPYPKIKYIIPNNKETLSKSSNYKFDLTPYIIDQVISNTGFIPFIFDPRAEIVTPPDIFRSNFLKNKYKEKSNQKFSSIEQTKERSKVVSFTIGDLVAIFKYANTDFTKVNKKLTLDISNDIAYIKLVDIYNHHLMIATRDGYEKEFLESFTDGFYQYSYEPWINTICQYLQSLNLLYPFLNSSIHTIKSYLHPDHPSDYNPCIIFEGAGKLNSELETSNILNEKTSSYAHQNITSVAFEYGIINVLPVYSVPTYTIDRSHCVNSIDYRDHLYNIDLLQTSIINNQANLMSLGLFGSSSNSLPNFCSFYLSAVESGHSDIFQPTYTSISNLEEDLFPISKIANSEYSILVTDKEKIKDLDLIIKKLNPNDGYSNTLAQRAVDQSNNFKEVFLSTQIDKFLKSAQESKLFRNMKFNKDNEFHFIKFYMHSYDLCFFPFETEHLNNQPFLNKSRLSIENYQALFPANKINSNFYHANYSSEIDRKDKFLFTTVNILNTYSEILNTCFENSTFFRKYISSYASFKINFESILNGKTVADFANLLIENTFTSRFYKESNNLFLTTSFFSTFFANFKNEIFSILNSYANLDPFELDSLTNYISKYFSSQFFSYTKGEMFQLFFSPQLIQLMLVQDLEKQHIDEIFKNIVNLINGASWAIPYLEKNTILKPSYIEHKYLYIDNVLKYQWLEDFSNLYLTTLQSVKEELDISSSKDSEKSQILIDIWETIANTSFKDNQLFKENHITSDFQVDSNQNNHLAASIVALFSTLNNLNKLDLFLEISFNIPISLISSNTKLNDNDLSDISIVDNFLYHKNNNYIFEEIISEQYDDRDYQKVILFIINGLQIADSIFISARKNSNKSLRKQTWLRKYKNETINNRSFYNFLKQSLTSLVFLPLPLASERTLDSKETCFFTKKSPLPLYLSKFYKDFKGTMEILPSPDNGKACGSSYTLTTIELKNGKSIDIAIENIHNIYHQDFIHSLAINAARMKAIDMYFASNEFKNYKLKDLINSSSDLQPYISLKALESKYLNYSVNPFDIKKYIHINSQPYIDAEAINKALIFDETCTSIKQLNPFQAVLPGNSYTDETLNQRTSLAWIFTSDKIKSRELSKISLKDLIDTHSKFQLCSDDDYLIVLNYIHGLLLKAFDFILSQIKKAEYYFIHNFLEINQYKKPFPPALDLFLLGNQKSGDSDNPISESIKDNLINEFIKDIFKDIKINKNNKSSNYKETAYKVVTDLIKSYIDSIVNIKNMDDLITQFPYSLENHSFYRPYSCPETGLLKYGQSIDSYLTTNYGSKTSALFNFVKFDYYQKDAINNLSRDPYILNTGYLKSSIHYLYRAFTVKDKSSIASIMTTYEPTGLFRFDSSFSPWNLSPVTMAPISSITNRVDSLYIYEENKKSEDLVSILITNETYRKILGAEDIEDFFHFYFDKYSESIALDNLVVYQHLIQLLKIVLASNPQYENSFSLNILIFDLLFPSRHSSDSLRHNYVSTFNPKNNIENITSNKAIINNLSFLYSEKNLELSPEIKNLFTNHLDFHQKANEIFSSIDSIINSFSRSQGLSYPKIAKLPIQSLIVGIIAKVFKEHNLNFYNLESLATLDNSKFREVFNTPSSFLNELKLNFEQNSYSYKNNYLTMEATGRESKFINTPNRELHFHDPANKVNPYYKICNLFSGTSLAAKTLHLVSLDSQNHAYDFDPISSIGYNLIKSSTLKGFIMGILSVLKTMKPLTIDPLCCLSYNRELSLANPSRFGNPQKQKQIYNSLSLEKDFINFVYLNLKPRKEFISYPRSLSIGRTLNSSPSLSNLTTRQPPDNIIIPLTY
jgi:hypothetical protein